MTNIVVPDPKTDVIYRAELLQHIQNTINSHPRSAQAEIGPSEIGGCETKVAWKVTHGGDADHDGGWAAAKGSVLHKWLDEEVFAKGPSLMPDGTQRWYSDMKLDAVSEHVNGGTLDLYDRLYQRVLDFKLPGSWSVKQVRGGATSRGYWIQAQVYGLGLERMGYPVQEVGILWLPMDGDSLHETARGAILKLWDFDRQVAIDALERVAAIKRLVAAVGLPEAMEVLPKMSDFCSGCPAFHAQADRRATCPGVTGRAVKDNSNPFS